MAPDRPTPPLGRRAGVECRPTLKISPRVCDRHDLFLPDTRRCTVPGCSGHTGSGSGCAGDALS